MIEQLPHSEEVEARNKPKMPPAVRILLIVVVAALPAIIAWLYLNAISNSSGRTAFDLREMAYPRLFMIAMAACLALGLLGVRHPIRYAFLQACAVTAVAFGGDPPLVCGGPIAWTLNTFLAFGRFGKFVRERFILRVP